MAKAFAPPKGYDFDFKFDFDGSDDTFKKFDEACEKYVKRLRKFCKKHSDSNSPLVGETIKTPKADGYAVYMVFRTKPLQIIHVPIGDAWHADPVWIRGLRLKDVKEMVENEKALAKMFGGKE